VDVKIPRRPWVAGDLKERRLRAPFCFLDDAGDNVFGGFAVFLG